MVGSGLGVENAMSNLLTSLSGDYVQRRGKMPFYESATTSKQMADFFCVLTP